MSGQWSGSCPRMRRASAYSASTPVPHRARGRPRRTHRLPRSPAEQAPIEAVASAGMRLEGINPGDIVEVAHRSGRRFLAVVTGPAPGGLQVNPLDRRVNYYTCKAREVAVHWER